MVVSRRSDTVIRTRTDLYNYVMYSPRPPAVRFLALGIAENKIQRRIADLKSTLYELRRDYKYNQFSGKRHALLIEIHTMEERLAHEDKIVFERFSVTDLDEILDDAENQITLAGAETIVEEVNKWHMWRGILIGGLGNFAFSLAIIFAAWFVVRVESVDLKHVFNLIFGVPPHF
jgi:hypothetical protein